MRTLLLLLGIFGAVALQAQSNDKEKPAIEQIRRYWFVLLTKGQTRNQDAAAAAEIQKGHLANIGKLYNEGKIKVAGPFGEEGDWQGIFIFDCPEKAEVEQLLQTDPAVKAGRLAFTIKPWYTAPIGSFVPGKPNTPTQNQPKP